MAAIIVKVSLGNLPEVRRAFAPGSRMLRRVYRAQALVYAEAMRTRFATFSAGGGTWAPLSSATIFGRLARRGTGTARLAKLKAKLRSDIEADSDGAWGKYFKAVASLKRSIAKRRAGERAHVRGQRTLPLGYQTGGAQILRDTGTLFRGLSIRSAGNQTIDIAEGLSYGFRGPHPRGSLTLARLATIHHYGGGRLPARPILVDPDPATVARMEEVTNRLVAATVGGRA